MRHPAFRAALSVGICAATISLCAPWDAARAQEAPPEEDASQGGVQDIIVTAQKRSERLQDVPIAVTAISGEDLESRGVAKTLELAQAVPGLSYPVNLVSAVPRIRGVGTTSAVAGNEAAVATYIDGVYYASAASSLLSLSNIEQIAVLKGPQGTLFGRNATGGLIQITTKEPSQTFSGSVAATIGNHDTYGGSLYVTGGLGESVSADLAVYYNDQRDGFGRNITTGRDVNKSRELAIRSKFLFQLGDSTDFTLAGDYADMHVAGPARRPAMGTTTITGVPYAGGPFDIESNIDNGTQTEQFGVSAKFVHRFGTVDLVSITAYRRADTHVLFDIDATPLSLFSSDIEFEDRQFSQELQLISTASGPFKWTLGGYYFRGSGAYARATAGLPTLIQYIETKQRIRSPSIYGQASYDFSDATSLTLGLRYTHEKRLFDGRADIFTRATGITAPTVPVSGELPEGRVTWRASIDQKVSPNVLIYASYNRGFKSGGFNGAKFAVAESFRSEVLDAFEVGIKSDFLDRKLRINGAAYYYDYQDLQISSYVNGTVQFSNAAAAEIYGVDLEVTAKPFDALTLTSGFAYTHARFKSFPTAQTSTPLPTGGNLISPGDASGNKVPYTPDWTFSIGADYRAQLPTGSLQFNVNYYHNDGFFGEPENRLRQKAYDLLNGSIRWNLDADERVSLLLWGRNLTNQVYATQTIAQAQLDLYVPAPGRTFGATASFRW